MQWGLACLECCLSSKAFIACCMGSEATWKWWCPTSLSRWKWIGVRPVIASTPHVGDIWKTPVIHRVALCCIFFRSFRDRKWEHLWNTIVGVHRVQWGVCKGTSRVTLSHHWGPVLLVAHWQSCTRSHSSCLLSVCVMRCEPSILTLGH